MTTIRHALYTAAQTSTTPSGARRGPLYSTSEVQRRMGPQRTVLQREYNFFGCFIITSPFHYLL
jgi:hypothetical protein